jgi:outer membrane protein assembly factor BamA
LYDSRKNINNPLQGFYSSIAYRNNSTFLGSDHNWQSLLLEFRKYIKLSSHSNNVLAFWSYNWFTFGGKPPYFDLPSTGWDTFSNVGRGYIQGRLRGTSLIYLETEYRFGITHNGLLGGVVFVNAQSIPEIQSNRFETILPGGGFGLRIKANKHSNANLCIDYGFGIQGSHGLFFNLCEAF